MPLSDRTLPQPKILFVDEPFSETEGIRAERSRFIWSVLSETCDADLLLLKTSVYQEKPVAMHSGYDKLYSLSLDGEKSLMPQGYHKLGTGQSERFAGILDSKRYEMVVLAGLACLPLSRMVHKVLPACPVILDVDSLYQNELEKAWIENKKAENYLAWWELAKQKLGDKLLINRHNHYIFANPADLSNLAARFKLPSESLSLLPLPLAAYETTADEDLEADSRFILFWGDPAERENLSAARSLISEIYPRISKRLVEKNINLILCGDESLKELCGGRILHAPFSSLGALLERALFILLPLAAPDREMRALRCAQSNKALICSKAAIEGLELPADGLFAESSNEVIVERIVGVLRAPKQLQDSAKLLHDCYLANWTEEKLRSKLTKILNKRIKPDYE